MCRAQLHQSPAVRAAIAILLLTPMPAAALEVFFDHGQLRFNVDAESATRARLQISSRLLGLTQHLQDAISQNGRRARIGLRWTLWTR